MFNLQHPCVRLLNWYEPTIRLVLFQNDFCSKFILKDFSVLESLPHSSYSPPKTVFVFSLFVLKVRKNTKSSVLKLSQYSTLFFVVCRNGTYRFSEDIESECRTCQQGFYGRFCAFPCNCYGRYVLLTTSLITNHNSKKYFIIPSLFLKNNRKLKDDLYCLNLNCHFY